jgi:kumamolisin
MRHGSPTRMRAAAVGLVGVAALAVSASPGWAASGATKLATVSPGLTTASLPSDATPFGTTPASTPEIVSFVLKMRGEGGLAAEVEQGSTHFLSVGQFAATYGQRSSTIAALESYLAGFGITTKSYPDNLDVVANGTAGEFDSALSESQENFHVPAVRGGAGGYSIPAQNVHAISGPPSLPEPLAEDVAAILGLTNYGAAVSNATHIPKSVPKPQDASDTSGTACAYCQTTADFAQNYGLNPLYSEGAAGQGQTIAIITLAGLDVGDPEYYWTNVLGQKNGNRPVSVVNVDGGPGAPSFAAGSSETDLDVEQAGGLAPGTKVVVYQSPNTDYGFVDSYFQAASDNTASSVSTSWGEDDTGLLASISGGQESPGYVVAFDEALLEMAAQGQSTFAPAGDSGAYDGVDDLGTTDLSTDFPSDSPFTTAAGGTTLPWSGTLTNTTTNVSASVDVPQQRAWGWDYLWQPIATIEGESLEQAALTDIGGGGGGFSQVEQKPWYQYGVSGTSTYTAVPYLTPTDPTDLGGGFYADEGFNFDAYPRLTSGYGFGRADPDVSADADPYSGYYLYSSSFVSGGYGPALEPGWGGTSFVGPQLNGSTAVFESLLGHRIGLWNPAIYRFADSFNSPFTALSSASHNNDNLYYSGTPGTLYNEASGLGYPNLARLESDFAH